MNTAASRAESASLRIRRRRAVGHVVMSVLLPGSAQIQGGAPRAGHIALRVWAALWLGCAAILAGLWLAPGAVIGFLLHPVSLWLARAGVWLVALGWIGIQLDALRRANWMRPAIRVRAVLTLMVVLLCVTVGTLASVVSATLASLARVSTVFGGSGESESHDGRYNILLLGGDSGPSREGLRPDSIMVASIDAATGQTVLFGLPRNLEGAPLPPSNPLHALYPNGYDCPKSECMLNGLYTLAEERRDLFPGEPEPGLRTMTESVEEILGLKINFYAMVDLAGFTDLVDAVGGIRLDIARPVPIGGVSTKVSGYIQPGKGVLLDGYHALWFARSREGSDDYERMQRQRCVLAAMSKQLDPWTVATKFNDLAAAGSGMFKTSAAPGDIAVLADLALRARDRRIASVSFVPPLIQPGRPDFGLIRTRVAAAIAEAADEPSTTPGTAAPPATAGGAQATRAPKTTRPAGTSPPRPGEGQPPAQAEDLEVICRAAG
ncbi:MAG: LCP family protein [Propionibacteriaceae bacterium]|nr:LCP family protein [Propionibacteriaceae bacterium]